MSDNDIIGQLMGVVQSVKQFKSKQRFELARELKYRKRTTTSENKIGDKVEGFLTKYAMIQKDFALNLVKISKMFDIIDFKQEQKLRSWIFGWE